jgi:hypothetical protein
MPAQISSILPVLAKTPFYVLPNIAGQTVILTIAYNGAILA